MSDKNNVLFEEYTIDTPENVIFDYYIAGIGSRFIGALVDTFILGVTLAALGLFLGMVLALLGLSPPDIFSGGGEQSSWGAGVILALYFLLNFILMWGYFTFFEIIWNGQTPGKRVAKTRVIDHSGSPASALSIVIRNLVRIVDWLPWAYLAGLITMMLNDQSRRLGDYAAGVIVIRLQDDDGESLLDTAGAGGGVSMAVERRLKQLSLEDVQRLYKTYPHIQRLTPAEYELAEEVTFGPRAMMLDVSARPRLVRIISPKIGGPLPHPSGGDIEAMRILKEIVLLYNIHHAEAAGAEKSEG